MRNQWLISDSSILTVIKESTEAVSPGKNDLSNMVFVAAEQIKAHCKVSVMLLSPWMLN